MSIFQLNQVKDIYPSREKAIQKLDSLSFPSATPVTIRYKEKIFTSTNNSCACSDGDCCKGGTYDEAIGLILAVYITDTSGNYTIIHDSSQKVNINSNPYQVYTVSIKDEVSFEDIVRRALFGKTPTNGDILIVNYQESDSINSWVYWEGSWKIMASGLMSGGNSNPSIIYGGTF